MESDIETIYDLNIEKIYRFFYYKTLSKEIAEDLTSETFLQFIDQIKKEKEIVNLISYLFGIARIVFSNYLKRKYKTEIPLSNGLDNFAAKIDDYLEESDQETAEEKIRKYLNFIPQSQRVVVELRLIYKLTLSEIAQKLGKDMNYVKTNQKRGIKSLKKVIETSLI